MNERRFDFGDSKSSVNTTVIVRSEAGDLDDDRRIIAAFVAATAQIAADFILGHKNPLAAYKATVEAFAGSLTQAIGNRQGAMKLFMQIIVDPEAKGGTNP